MLNHGQWFLLAEIEEETLPLVLTDVIYLMAQVHWAKKLWTESVESGNQNKIFLLSAVYMKHLATVTIKITNIGSS